MNEPENHVPRSILIIRLSSLGDVVLASHIPRVLKDRLPGVRVTFLTRSGYAPVLEHNPFIDRLIGLNEIDLTPAGMIRLACDLRKSGFDVLVDLHGNLRARIISAIVRAPKTLRVRKDGLRRRAFVRGYLRNGYRKEHVVGDYLRTINPILEWARGGMTGRDTGQDFLPEVHVGNGELAEAKVILEKLCRTSTPVIGICPGARWKTKAWGEKKYGTLVRRIVDDAGWKAIVFIDNEGTISPERMGFDGDARSVLFVRGRLGLVSGLLSLCSAVVTNDSGLMHLSSALGTRVVAIFGPTTPALGFSPLGEGNRVIVKDLECQPCSLHGEKDCRLGTMECMESVSVDEVFNALKQVLDNPQGINS